jgi:hypothetical protein
LFGHSTGVIAYSPYDDVWGFATHLNTSQEALYFRRSEPNNWEGPYVVVKVPGSGAFVNTAGLTYLEADGTPRVVVRQQDSGDPEAKANVYSASPGGTDFSFLTELKAVTTATTQMGTLLAVPGTGGEPAVAVIYKPIVDDSWNFDLFVSDAPGSWSLGETWDSPLRSFYPSMAANASGMPAVAAVENSLVPATSHSVIVFYPW